MATLGTQTYEGGTVPSPSSGTISVVNTPVHNGSWALRSNPATTNAGWSKAYSFSATTTVYHRFYFRYATKPASGNEDIFWAAGSGNTRKLVVALDSAGKLSVYDSSRALVATGTTVLAANTWYRINLKCTDGVAGAYALQIDGVAELSGTADTTIGAPGNNGGCLCGKVLNTSNQTVDFFYDDVRTDDTDFPPTEPSPSPSTSPSTSESVSPSTSESRSPSVSPSTSESTSPSTSASASPSTSPSTSESTSASTSPSGSVSPSTSPSTSSSTSESASPSTSASTSESVSPSTSESASPSASESGSISPSMSPSLSTSPSTSASASPSRSASASPSHSVSASPSLSESASPSLSPSRSTSSSASTSVSSSPSASASASQSTSASASASASESRSPSLSSSPSPSTSVSSSVSVSSGEEEVPCDLNLGNLVFRVLDMLDDVPGVYWTRAEIVHALNVAQRLWCLLTLCLEHTMEFALAPNVAFYTISSQIDDYIVPLRVTFNGARLKSDTIHNLDLRSRSWRLTSGDPKRYAQHGFDLLAVTPQPSSGSPIPMLTITYAAEPVEMVNDGDVPDIQPEQQIHLQDFAFWYARLKEGGVELQNAVANLNSFLDAAAKYASFTRARSRAQLYDNFPPDLSTFERGRFEIKLRNQPPKQTEVKKTNA